MKHSMDGIYRIPTMRKLTYTYTYCTKAYLEANGIEVGSLRKARYEEGKAYKVHAITAKSFVLHDIGGAKRVYLYGVDTEEELAEYRKNN